jgi:hypothetical protein
MDKDEASSMGVVESLRRLPEKYGIAGKGVSDYVSAAANVINPKFSREINAERSLHAGQQGKDRITGYSDDELAEKLYLQEGTVFDTAAKDNFSNLVKTDRKEAENMLNRAADSSTKTRLKYEDDAQNKMSALAGGIQGALEMPGYAATMPIAMLTIPMNMMSNIKENAAPTLSLDVDGDIVPTREAMDVMENLGKSATSALLEFGIERFGGDVAKAVAKPIGALAGAAGKKIANKVLPSGLIDMADKMASGVTKYGADFLESHPKVATATENWKRFGKWSGDITGVGTLPEELSEEYIQAAADAALNLRNDNEEWGISNVPPALLEVAKQTPEILISMALYKAAGAGATHVALGMGDKDRQETLKNMGVASDTIAKMSRGERADYLHEMADAQLSPEVVANIQSMIEHAKQNPPVTPTSRMDLLTGERLDTKGATQLQASTGTPQPGVPTANPKQQVEVDWAKQDAAQDWPLYLQQADGDEMAAARMVRDDWQAKDDRAPRGMTALPASRREDAPALRNIGRVDLQRKQAAEQAEQEDREATIYELMRGGMSRPEAEQELDAQQQPGIPQQPGAPTQQGVPGDVEQEELQAVRQDEMQVQDGREALALAPAAPLTALPVRQSARPDVPLGAENQGNPAEQEQQTALPTGRTADEAGQNGLSGLQPTETQGIKPNTVPSTPDSPVQSIGKPYAESTDDNSKPFTELPYRGRAAFNEAWDTKDITKLIQAVYPSNPRYRAEFEHRTGLKLPKKVSDLPQRTRRLGRLWKTRPSA